MATSVKTVDGSHELPGYILLHRWQLFRNFLQIQILDGTNFALLGFNGLSHCSSCSAGEFPHRHLLLQVSVSVLFDSMFKTMVTLGQSCSYIFYFSLQLVRQTLLSAELGQLVFSQSTSSPSILSC